MISALKRCRSYCVDLRKMKRIVASICAFIFLCALALYADQPGAIRSVTVHLADGSSQQFNPTSQPAVDEANAKANTANPPPDPSICMGINLEALRDYDRSFMFIDAMRTCRRFGTVKAPHD